MRPTCLNEILNAGDVNAKHVMGSSVSKKRISMRRKREAEEQLPWG